MPLGRGAVLAQRFHIMGNGISCDIEKTPVPANRVQAQCK